MRDDLDRLQHILTQAGEQALALFDGRAGRQVDLKAPGDLVSDADRTVERGLRAGLSAAFPDCDLLGEEYGGTATGRFWAIDPIDGTTNFLSGLPFWTVSAGLMQGDTPLMGGIVAPALGLAAYCTAGQPLRLVGFGAGSRPDAALAIGLGRNPRWPAEARLALDVAAGRAGLGVRLFGFCALSLMLVATGRLRGYVEDRIGGLWDCAGGLALCRAAGVPYRFALHPDGTVDLRAGDLTGLPA